MSFDGEKSTHPQNKMRSFCIQNNYSDREEKNVEAKSDAIKTTQNACSFLLDVGNRQPKPPGFSIKIGFLIVTDLKINCDGLCVCERQAERESQ